MQIKYIFDCYTVLLLCTYTPSYFTNKNVLWTSQINMSCELTLVHPPIFVLKVGQVYCIITGVIHENKHTFWLNGTDPDKTARFHKLQWPKQDNENSAYTKKKTRPKSKIILRKCHGTSLLFTGQGQQHDACCLELHDKRWNTSKKTI